jgi:hypothetical protein
MFGKRFEKMKKLPKSFLCLHMLGKVLLLLGIGALLVSYFPGPFFGYDWKFWGLVLVALGILVKLPGFLKMHFK